MLPSLFTGFSMNDELQKILARLFSLVWIALPNQVYYKLYVSPSCKFLRKFLQKSLPYPCFSTTTKHYYRGGKIPPDPANMTHIQPALYTVDQSQVGQTQPAVTWVILGLTNITWITHVNQHV